MARDPLLNAIPGVLDVLEEAEGAHDPSSAVVDRDEDLAAIARDTVHCTIDRCISLGKLGIMLAKPSRVLATSYRSAWLCSLGVHPQEGQTLRDLLQLRKVGEGAMRRIADMFADDTNPLQDTDVHVDATIIFADIESFSDVVAREGDEVAIDILDRLDTAVESAIGQTGARVVKQLGDGVMIAAEDPSEGLAVAVDLVEAFNEAVSDLHTPMRLRVGAHRGAVRQRGNDLIGYHVNVAARVAEFALGGHCVVTGALLSACPPEASLVVSPAGELLAKGVPESPPLFGVRRERAVTGDATPVDPTLSGAA